MDIGLYQGASSLVGLEQWQQAVAHNIATGSIPGYKGTQVSFESVASGVMQSRSDPHFARTMGAEFPQQGSQTDFTEGGLTATGNPYDVALRGPGFFATEDAQGGKLYTRDGTFHVSNEGTLVSKQGYPVLDEGGAPITIDPALGEPTINARGEISQQGMTVARIGVFSFENTDSLVRAQGGFRFQGDPGQGALPVMEPVLEQGYLESSNVNVLNEMVHLISLSRAYEASQKVISNQDENLGKAVQILGSTR